MKDDMFDGPYGLLAIDIVAAHVTPPLHCRVRLDKYKQDVCGAAIIRDDNGLFVADARLSEQSADEREQAVQWFCDLISAKFCMEVQR